MSKLIDLTGKTFGRLNVLCRVQNRKTPKGQTRTMWLCKCRCGNEREITSKHLIRGLTRSCGCYKAERFLKPHILPEGQAARNALLSSYKASARKRNIVFELDDSLFDFLIKQPCCYCGSRPSQTFRGKNGDILYNGIDRINSNVGYTKSNVVSCCKICNIAKQSLTVEEFIDWARRVVDHASRKVGGTVSELSSLTELSAPGLKR